MDPLKKIWINTFARQRFHKFNDRLLRRGLTGLGVNDFGPRQEAGERYVMEKLVRVLPQGAVVCDVGAHTGLYSLFFANRRPDLVIHAFEPNPATYNKLAAAAGGTFTTHQYALGDKDGEAVLHDPKTGESECASLVGEAIDGLYGDRPKSTVTVQVKKLDDFLAQQNIHRVDYIKIDAEGYDLMVLKGAAKSIAAGKLGVVQFEFGPANMFSRTFMRDFYQILPRHRMYRIVQDGLVPLGKYNPTTYELFGLQNIVAVPEGMNF